MRIGIVYDLRDDYLAQGFTEEEASEFDAPVTIDAIDGALRAAGHTAVRIGHIKSLVRALAAGERWDLVFNIAEGVRGIAREAQVPSLLEAYGIPYTFSAPETLVATMDKELAKKIVRDARVPTPPSAIVREARDIEGIDLPFPVFAKPLAEGTSKGVSALSRIEDAAALRATCLDLLHRFRQPVLVETFLPGREFTVGLLGSGKAARVIGTMEILLKEDAEQWCYSYFNKTEAKEEMVAAHGGIARKAADTALSAWRALSCRGAGRVDIRLDEAGVPNFIEANPLAGLRPDYSELPVLAEQAGMSYNALIAAIVDEAALHYGLALPPVASQCDDPQDEMRHTA